MMRLLALTPLLLIAIVTPSRAEEWSLTAQSQISLAYFGSPVDGMGQIDGVVGTIWFDPYDLESFSADILIDLETLSMRDRHADDLARDRLWLHTGEYPTARYRTVGAVLEGDGFVTLGNLTLKGVTMPVSVSFQVTLPETGGASTAATAVGEAVVDRHLFDVGNRDEEVDEAMDAGVHLTFDLVAEPR